MFEAGTVFTTAALMMLANGLVLAIVSRDLPAALHPAAFYWQVGTMLIAAGCALFAFGGVLPRPVMLLGSNAMLTFGLTAYHAALQHFNGKRPSRWQLLPGIVAIAGVGWFSIVTVDFLSRLAVVSVAWVWLMLASMWVLRSGTQNDGSLSRRILFGLFGIVVVFTLARGITYPLLGPGRDFAVESGANWLNLLSPIFMTVLPVVGTTAFLLMCSDKLRRQLEAAAATDYLTGLPNRRTLASHGKARFQQAAGRGTGLAVAILDIDNFKAINDTYGHEVGDQVLVHVADCLRAELRGTDVIARTGGEEFAVLLDEPGHVEALAVVERMRLAIERARFDMNGVTIAVTLSAGVAVHRPGDRTFEDLARRADQALYAAKAAGRNRVVSARLSLVGGPRG